MKSSILFLTLFLLCELYFPSTLNVPSHYSTIQSVLNAAQYGDTVLVVPGTYFENIIWPNTDGIKLIGSKQNNTLVDGRAIASVLNINQGRVNITSQTEINGFTIANGKADRGAGIYLANTSPSFPTLISSIILVDILVAAYMLITATVSLPPPQ
jgi:hypothetical protein